MKLRVLNLWLCHLLCYSRNNTAYLQYGRMGWQSRSCDAATCRYCLKTERMCELSILLYNTLICEQFQIYFYSTMVNLQLVRLITKVKRIIKCRKILTFRRCPVSYVTYSYCIFCIMEWLFGNVLSSIRAWKWLSHAKNNIISRAQISNLCAPFCKHKFLIWKHGLSFPWHLLGSGHYL